MGPNWRIFSAAIFRGTVLRLVGGAEPSERALLIPAHGQLALARKLACIQHGWLTASDDLLYDPWIAGV